MLFTKRARVRARKLAAECYVAENGDVEKASALAKSRVGEVGSPLVMLMIAGAVLQAIYYAIKIWKEWHYATPPRLPAMGEGFGLAAGEPYAMTPEEFEAMRDQ